MRDDQSVRPNFDPGRSTCGRWKCGDLIDFVDGEVVGSRAREIEGHLATCEACRTYVASARRALAAAAGVPVAEPAEAYWSCFEQVVRERARDRIRSRRRLFAFLLAPGLAVLAAALLIVIALLSASQPRPGGRNASELSAVRLGPATSVDSLLVSLLAQAPEKDVSSLEEYLGEDEAGDIPDLIYDLSPSEKQNLLSRLSEIMKLKS